MCIKKLYIYRGVNEGKAPSSSNQVESAVQAPQSKSVVI